MNAHGMTYILHDMPYIKTHRLCGIVNKEAPKREENKEHVYWISKATLSAATHLAQKEPVDKAVAAAAESVTA
eukprot:4705787-Amphidinium_carterae.1